jgi:hypothetical protein
VSSCRSRRLTSSKTSAPRSGRAAAHRGQAKPSPPSPPPPLLRPDLRCAASTLPRSAPGRSGGPVLSSSCLFPRRIRATSLDMHGLHRIQHCCVAVDPAPHRIRRRGHRRPRAGSAHLRDAPALGGHQVGPTAACRPSSALGPTQQHGPELDTSTSTLRHGDPSSH